MTARLLVLGGSGFVGPAVVDEGLARGFEVTTFNRGTATAPAPPGVRAIVGDRLTPATLQPLTDRDWDVVVDTWSAAPRAVRDSALALQDRVGHYAYVSSESVYTPPPPRGATEDAPTVAASPDAEQGEYAELKRGAELALEAALPDRWLAARAGLILGPRENVGRLTWWLERMARGGEVLCPAPAQLPIQFVDARDLARFLLDASSAGATGPFNVVCRRGPVTLGTLLEACRSVTADAGGPPARLTWVDPAAIEAAGIEPWSELPVWILDDHAYAGLHDADVEHAHAAGLDCRPVAQTVADTWAWMSTDAHPLPERPGIPAPGLAADRERAVLAAWRGRPQDSRSS